MNELIAFGILAFWSIFAIIDPLTTIPAFLVMTETNTVQERVRTAWLASVIAFFVLTVFSLGGQSVLWAFGVTLPAFEIAGGIILLKIALDMLEARRTALKETPEEQAEGVSKHEIAVTPLAIPMMAGPGAITAVVLISAKATTGYHYGIVLASILAASFLSFLILRAAALRSDLFGPITIKILSRLMGLLLAAIAVQFILNGAITAVRAGW